MTGKSGAELMTYAQRGHRDHRGHRCGRSPAAATACDLPKSAKQLNGAVLWRRRRKVPCHMQRTQYVLNFERAFRDRRTPPARRIGRRSDLRYMTVKVIYRDVQNDR